MFPCNCRPPFPRPEPFSPLPRPGTVPDWGKWIRDRLAEKGALLAFPTRASFPDPGAQPNVYLAEDTDVVYRWDGAQYQVVFDPESANDVLEYEDRGRFPETGRSGVVYIDASANLIYRWGGTGYVPLTSDLSGVESRLVDVESKVPAQATAQNQLADKAFVNSSIATNTAFYISDNGRPFQSLADLENYEGALTNNDYAFVVGRDAVGNTTYTRYKWNEATEAWAEEFVLNNSSFTAEQWAAISSGITSGLVAKLGALPTAEALAQSLAGKATKADVTLTPIFDPDPTKAMWVCDPAQVEGYPAYSVAWEEISPYSSAWVLSGGDGSQINPITAGDPNAATVSFQVTSHGITPGMPATVTATRVPVAYQLGAQDDKPVASKAEAEALRTGKANKSEMAITAVSGDATKKNIQLRSGMAQDVVVDHQQLIPNYGDPNDATWVCSPETYNGSPIVVFPEIGDTGVFFGWSLNVGALGIGSENSTNLTWPAGENATGAPVTATRTDAPISYQLGTQSDRKLATAEQGAKANTALQGVKVGSSPVTPDSNRVVSLGTAAAKNVPASGDASSTQVVMGNDSRLPKAEDSVQRALDNATPSAKTAVTIGVRSTEDAADRGQASLTVGDHPKASGPNAVATGTWTEATAPNARADGNLCKATNNGAHGEGNNTQATGPFSHTEGSDTAAPGLVAHAEGNYTTAPGTGAHTEGMFTKASGPGAHAEGSSLDKLADLLQAAGASAEIVVLFRQAATDAAGSFSHTEGLVTATSEMGSHVQGFRASDGGNPFSFVWQGYSGAVPTAAQMQALLDNPKSDDAQAALQCLVTALTARAAYTSKGPGTFCVNPAPQGGSTDPKSGFFIGDESLVDALKVPRIYNETKVDALDDKGQMFTSATEVGGHWEGSWTLYGRTYTGKIFFYEKSGDYYMWRYELSGGGYLTISYNSWDGTISASSPTGYLTVSPSSAPRSINPLDATSGAQLAGTYTLNGGSAGTLTYTPQASQLQTTPYSHLALETVPTRTIAAGTAYAAGDILGDSGKAYRCIQAYTSDATPEAPSADPTHWTEIPVLSQKADASVIPYDRITITTGQLQDHAVQKVTLNAATTTLSLPALTDLTGKVSDFGIDMVNGYAPSDTPTAASFQLAGTIGTDYNIIVPEGEDWSEMSALAAGEMAVYYFTLSAFAVNDKPTWEVMKKIVELVPVPSAP